MSEITMESRKEKLITTLATMFDYLGLSGNFRIEEKGQKLAVKITSDDAGRIIGRKGQTLDSLQLILNRIMFKGDDEFPRIMIDIDGYSSGEREPRERRESSGDEGAPRPPRSGGRRQSSRGGRGDFEPRQSTEQLEQQARDAAKEVKRWGDPVKMPEMNAHDRRIIHMALRDDPEITTESEGEGAMKKVVISLKKADEANSPKKDDAEV